MVQGPANPRSTSRRTVLGAGAALAGGSLAGIGVGGTAPPETTTVLTRNLYLGSSLAPALTAETKEELEDAVQEIYQNVVESRIDLRAQRIAEEIATTEPDLIGLQEASRFVEQSDDGSRVRDYFRTLATELEERELSYNGVAAVRTFHGEFPIDEPGSRRVGFTNRDVILAREGVETNDPDAGTYFAGGRELGIGRGYCSVTVEGTFTFVNTHLTTRVAPLLQYAQALELLTRFDEPPTVLVGDFNSGPGDPDTLAYDALTGRFTDAYAATNPDREGYTCCHRSTLFEEEPTLDRRIDHILVDGDVEPLQAERVGHEPEARIEGFWPSDHAGVVAELKLL